MAEEKQVGQYFDGDVLLQRWVNGVLDKEVIGPLSGTVLGIKPESEVKENLSKMRGTRGKKLDSVTLAKPTAFSLAFNRANSKLMAMAFLGVSAVKNALGGTLTAEPITLPHDQWMKVSERNISAVVIVGGVLNDDFEVNTRLGMIRSLSTGSLADGLVTTFNAIFGAINSLQIKGGVESRVDVQVILDGTNLVTGKDVYIRVPKVPLVADSDIDFLSDDYITVAFAGEMEKLDTEEAEFYVDTNVVLS